jgi:1,4-alpha-glucan branching enzyme
VVPLRTPPTVSPGSASLIATPIDKGATTLLVHAPGAQRVELVSDLTGWEARALERRRGRWEIRLTTQPGSHHVRVRIDGGAWIVPANLPRIDDEMGGTVGLIVIP